MSPFASRSILEHVGRGGCAAALVGLAFWSISTPGVMGGIVAAIALVGTVVLLRGCPMCWLIGLFETIARTARKDPRHD